MNWARALSNEDIRRVFEGGVSNRRMIPKKGV